MLRAEDAYASMEKDQLISRIHFLVKREDELVVLDIKAIMQGRTDYERSALPLATIGTQEHVTDDHRY